MVSIDLKYFKLSENARDPKRGSRLAAGLDLSSAEEKTIPAHGRALVKTDLVMTFPIGTYGRIAPRSGLALKQNITTDGGVIDADYRGNVGVIVRNHGDEDFDVKIGDRIAQIICERIVYAVPKEIKARKKNSEEANQLVPSSERGNRGFGSTGM